MKSKIENAYILYYDTNFHSAESVYGMMQDLKKALPGKPIVALPRDVDLQEVSSEEALKLIGMMIGIPPRETILNVTDLSSEPPSTGEAKWRIWAGWQSNHDQRIDNATCTSCGFIHPTVFRNKNLLNKTCPQCGKRMIGWEEFG